MEFGMKRILASVKAMAILSRLYTGSPVSVQALSKESGLSISYLEQLFKKLRAGNLVISQRGPGGGYIPREGDISVSEIIRTVIVYLTTEHLSPSLLHWMTCSFPKWWAEKHHSHKAQNPRKAGFAPEAADQSRNGIEF